MQIKSLLLIFRTVMAWSIETQNFQVWHLSQPRKEIRFLLVNYMILNKWLTRENTKTVRKYWFHVYFRRRLTSSYRKSKFRTISVLTTFLFACLSLRLKAELQRSIQVLVKCYRTIRDISQVDRIIIDAMQDTMKQEIGPLEVVVTALKKRKMKCYGHVLRGKQSFHCHPARSQLRQKKKGQAKRKGTDIVSE